SRRSLPAEPVESDAAPDRERDQQAHRLRGRHLPRRRPAQSNYRIVAHVGFAEAPGVNAGAFVTDTVLRSTRAMSGSDWLLLILLSIVWGGTFFFAKIALAELPPLTIVLMRVVIAATALHLLVIATGQRMPADRVLWRDFVIMGLLNNAIPFS